MCGSEVVRRDHWGQPGDRDRTSAGRQCICRPAPERAWPCTRRISSAQSNTDPTSFPASNRRRSCPRRRWPPDPAMRQPSRARALAQPLAEHHPAPAVNASTMETSRRTVSPRSCHPRSKHKQPRRCALHRLPRRGRRAGEPRAWDTATTAVAPGSIRASAGRSRKLRITLLDVHRRS